MATLVFSKIGTALGGPLGGAVGALAGRQLDGALFGSRRSGRQLRELEVSLSSYGVAIPQIHGRMRVAGAIVWATELQEHSELQGGGKAGAAPTTTSYAANLAVALSSRPILGLGRIWADGKLLRGSEGDLKVGGLLRVHTGHEDQPVDPLIAPSEGEARGCAFRGLAYAVFEGLELADFGNRIPALTFEVVAGPSANLAAMLGEALPACDVRDDGDLLTGFCIEDTLADGLATLAAVLPIAIDAAGETIVVRGESGESAILLDEAAGAVDDDAFGQASGASRRRAPAAQQPPAVLRYLDTDRDFQPATQHATGRAGPGQAEVFELPAALTAVQARSLVERMALRRDRARERLLWRTCTLDLAVAPGTRVRLPDRSGIWRVENWEWREAGVELDLVRLEPSPQPVSALPASEPFAAPLDLPAAQTRLVALELPWDAASASSDRPRRVAAVSATGANWAGAALYADHGDGQMWPLGHAPRTRAVVGVTLDALPAAGPLLLDRSSQCTIALAATDLALAPASLADLAGGANLALVGDELLQFGRAEALGGGTWRLSDLIRGCGGTEAAIAAHAAGEPFALVDARVTPLDSQALGPLSGTQILASGRGDAEPVASPLRLAGIGARPLAPVHGRTTPASEGSLRLVWTRRARGGWRWSDGVDVPLVEEAERYLVTLEQDGTTMRTWTTAVPAITFTPDDLATLPSGSLVVRQQGTHALSLPLFLTTLA